MSHRPGRPRNPLLAALPWLLAAVAAGGGYRLVRQLEGEPVDAATALARGPVAATATEGVERQWIAEAFPELYLSAPVSDLPCATGIEAARPFALRISEALSWLGEGRLDDAVAELGEVGRQDPANWVAPLALGMLLAREGRLSEAETVLAELHGRRTSQSTVRRAIEAAARHREGWGPPTEDVLGMVHLLHAYGFVLIEIRGAGEEAQRVLQEAVDASKLLALRGATDRTRRQPVWVEHRLTAPGCQPGEHSLTTLDLYNNLIVGELTVPGLGGAAEGLSRAEDLLEKRRDSGAGQLTDPRLAANLATLMESSPDAAARQKNAFLGIAMGGRAEAQPRQRPSLHRALARLQLAESVRSGAVATLPEDLAADLDEAQQAVARAVEAAVGQRRDVAAWMAAAVTADEALADALGERAAAWASASRRDFAATLAGRAAAVPPEERAWWARWARGVLAPGDEEPAELAELEEELGFAARFSTRRLLKSPPAAATLGVLAGALVWILATWLAVQLDHRRDLVTSFYRHEAQARLRRGR